MAGGIGWAIWPGLGIMLPSAATVLNNLLKTYDLSDREGYDFRKGMKNKSS